MGPVCPISDGCPERHSVLASHDSIALGYFARRLRRLGMEFQALGIARRIATGPLAGTLFVILPLMNLLLLLTAATVAHAALTCPGKIDVLKSVYRSTIESNQRLHKTHTSDHRELFKYAMAKKRFSRKRLEEASLVKMTFYHESDSRDHANCGADPLDAPDYYYMECSTNNDRLAKSESTIVVRLDEKAGVVTFCSETTFIQPIAFGDRNFTRMVTRTCNAFDLVQKIEVPVDPFYERPELQIELVMLRQLIELPENTEYRKVGPYDPHAHDLVYWSYASPVSEKDFVSQALNQLDWNCKVANARN